MDEDDGLDSLQNQWNSLSDMSVEQPVAVIDEEDWKTQDYGFGEMNAIKKLYATNKSACSCCINWDEEKPYREDEAKAKKAKEEREKFAIVQKETAHGGGNGWKTHSIEINSSLLREALKVVFLDYSAADISALDLSFRPPFVQFLHRWDRLLKAEDEEKASLKGDHLRLLRQLLEPQLEDSFRALRHLEETGFIEFPNLPLAFVPGDVLVHVTEDTISAGILCEISLQKSPYSDTKYYSFEVDVVDWNGHLTGIRNDYWFVDEYRGNKELVELNVHPLESRTDTESVDHFLYGPRKKSAKKPVKLVAVCA
jgi:hypothetical protein